MHIGLTGHVDVIGVIPGPCQEPHVLAPLWAGANTTILWHVFLLPEWAGRPASLSQRGQNSSRARLLLLKNTTGSSRGWPLDPWLILPRLR